MAEPLDYHTEKATGAHYLKNHFDITFLVCSNWVWNLHPDDSIYLKNSSKTNFEFKIIKSFEDLKIELKSTDPDFVFDCIYNQFSEKFRDMVRNLKAKYVLMNSGHIPTKDNKNFIWKFLKLLKNFFKSKKSCDIALLAGNKILKSYDLKKTKNICWIGSNDYYTYHKVKDYNKLQKPKFILYIDSGIFSSNNEFKILKVNNIPTDQQIKHFYNSVFNKFENYFKLPVLIAGHRRGKLYENYNDLFSGRKVLFDKTAELTIQSKFVLANFTTAVSFAVLSFKPIVFFTNTNFNNLLYIKCLNGISQELNSTVINADKNYVINDTILNTDIEKYKLYKANYIKNNMVSSKIPFNSFIEKYEK